jgi:hypothetical protein
MAPRIPDNQGGEVPLDRTGNPSSGAAGRTSLGLDAREVDRLVSGIDKITSAVTRLKDTATGAVKALGGIGSNTVGGGGVGGSPTSRGSVGGSMSSAMGLMANARGGSAARGGGGGSAIPTSTGGAGGGGGGGSGLGASAMKLINTMGQPAQDFSNYMSSRIGQGADYSLQADRMSTQLQQMYGMSNSQVRNQMRMPLTSHYLLGGGTAINDLLGMQANTGLSASKNASSVEAMRAVSGFSYGSGDITRMLSTMGSPDVANRMFMMGGTGMYKMGGEQRSGMQSIQDIVRRTGLTNPEALKGALQQGSNTRQRLNAMGVPQDMQDMVIQYAMQNSQFQKKTGGETMYDPSVEADRKTMGIEDNYAVSHEKTSGERIKREEKFYGRQTDNFSRFEKNLRTSTKMLSMFEDALSGIIGLGISAKGHPITNTVSYGMNAFKNFQMAALETGIDAAAAMGPGGDPVDSKKSTGTSANVGSSGSAQNVKLNKEDESKLATLDPRLAVPLRRMMEANPNLHIGDARRSTAQQEQGFRDRYRPTNKPVSEKGETDRIWKGVVWEMKPGEKRPPMAPPGQSFHERGLAVDLSQSESEWLRNNASRFGLETGATTKGARSDEPFHIQPAGTLGYSGPNSASSSAKAASGAGVSKSSVRKLSSVVSPLATNSLTSAPATLKNAGSMASEFLRSGGWKTESSSIGSTEKIGTLSNYGNSVAQGGDPVDRGNYSMGGSQGAGSIVISPNIYLNGGQDMTSDLRRIAKEVGALLEQEVKLKMMRTS